LADADVEGVVSTGEEFGGRHVDATAHEVADPRFHEFPDPDVTDALDGRRSARRNAERFRIGGRSKG
jgi:hypothetical protein